MSECLNENELPDDELFRLLIENEDYVRDVSNRIIFPDYNVITIDSIPGDKTIIHVYNSCYGAGLGDFLRGSIILAQCAKHFNLNFHISIEQHPILNYMKNQEVVLEELSPLNKKIHRCTRDCKHLYQVLSQFMNSSDKTIFIQCNLSYLIKFVTPDIKNYINNRFDFKDEYYDSALQYTSQFKQYTVLHIRCLDHHIFGDYKDDNLIDKIANLKLDKNTIVMASNYSVKKSISEMFGYYFIDKEAGHSDLSYYCPELYLTVIEYIILSKSVRNVCFSYYKHGSGFSEHSSVLNNIPYQVMFVDDPNFPVESREYQYEKYVRVWNEKWKERGF